MATKPELVGHFDPQYPDFELSFPDQLRVEEFLTHFRQWVQDRRQGHDTMPQFIQLRLPNDHTAGTTPGMPTPKASVADNDLAVGRAVEAIAHSPYWDDTAFFILEDDAQNGADHVDAHRSVALVVSKYSPRPRSRGGQHLLHHGERAADHGRAVRLAADEQQRRLRSAHRVAVYRRRRSATLRSGLSQSGQRAVVPGERAQGAGRAGVEPHGFHARGSGGSAGVECDPVAGCDGK